MLVHALLCPTCGGPLPAGARVGSVICGFCGATARIEQSAVFAADYARAAAALDLPDDGTAPRVRLGGLPYRVLGRMARGDGADVFLATRARRLTERVVLKVPRPGADVERLTREWVALRALQASAAPGAPHFTTRLPQPVAHGELFTDAGRLGPASAFRHASGFVYSFEDVLRAHPGGVDARHGVWLWRRVLEVLGFMHRAGWIHGALQPAHLLVHARDHGVMPVGFGSATELGRPLPKPPASGLGATPAFPDLPRAGTPATASIDLKMAARAIAWVLGYDPSSGRGPASVPAPLADLLRAQCGARDGGPAPEDAFGLAERVAAAAREAFGPPRYHRLSMPAFR